MIRKKLSLCILIFLFSMTSIFALGSSESSMVFIPRNVVNNEGVAIELTQQKSYSYSDIDSSISNNSTADNLALFRIRNTLKKDDQDNTTKTNGVILTLTSQNGWYFVNENNPTEKRAFTLTASCYESKENNGSYSSASGVNISSNGSSLPKSGESVRFTYSGGTYTLNMPTSSYVALAGSGKRAQYIRDFDISIAIPDTNENLEPGYYTTTINYSTTNFKEGDTTANLSGTITIRGYVGLEPGTTNSTYSFTVSAAQDTYSMDLKIKSNPTPRYQVATARFQCVSIDSSSGSSDRFKIYISPTANNTTGGTYMFVKMNSENQARTTANTVYYDLVLKTGTSSYTLINNCTSRTSFSEGTIAGAGKNSSGTNIYYMTPVLSSTQIQKSEFAGSNLYENTWYLEQNIYLELTSESLTSTNRQAGLYYSYIYFIVEDSN